MDGLAKRFVPTLQHSVTVSTLSSLQLGRGPLVLSCRHPETERFQWSYVHDVVPLRVHYVHAFHHEESASCIDDLHRLKRNVSHWDRSHSQDFDCFKKCSEPASSQGSPTRRSGPCRSQFSYNLVAAQVKSSHITNFRTLSCITRAITYTTVYVVRPSYRLQRDRQWAGTMPTPPRLLARYIQCQA